MRNSVKTVSFKCIAILVLMPPLEPKTGFPLYYVLLYKIKCYVPKHNFSFGNLHILLWSFCFNLHSCMYKMTLDPRLNTNEDITPH